MVRFPPAGAKIDHSNRKSVAHMADREVQVSIPNIMPRSQPDKCAFMTGILSRSSEFGQLVIRNRRRALRYGPRASFGYLVSDSVAIRELRVRIRKGIHRNAQSFKVERAAGQAFIRRGMSIECVLGRAMDPFWWRLWRQGSLMTFAANCHCVTVQ